MAISFVSGKKGNTTNKTAHNNNANINIVLNKGVVEKKDRKNNEQKTRYFNKFSFGIIQVI